MSTDNILTFHHSYRMGNERAPKSNFITLYENCFIEWELTCLRSVLRGPQASNNSQVRLRESGFRSTRPIPTLIEISLNILDRKMRPKFSAITYRINILNRQRTNLFGGSYYETEGNTDFSRLLKQMLQFYREGETSEVIVKIEYKKSEFLAQKCISTNVAEPISQELDYTFNSLRNPSRFDLKLKTTDGQVMLANKQMLYIASEYFREHLTSLCTEITLETDSLLAIETVITYLVTGKYKKVPNMTPTLAKDIIRLTRNLNPINRMALMNSIEKECLDEICKNDEDLNYVLTCLLTAQEIGMPVLQDACIACIISRHFQFFITDVLTGPNNQFRDGLNMRRGIGRGSLSNMIKRVFVGTQAVCRFMRSDEQYYVEE